MALKNYIVKQTTNWNERGEKIGTSIVTMDSAEITSYIALLDGKVEVYEQNLSLSKDSPVASASLNVVDYIKIKHNVLKPIYISNSNKRPLVFNAPIEIVIATLSAIKPFDAPYATDLPTDVSVDSGNLSLL